MNTKLLALIALTLGAQSMFGIDLSPEQIAQQLNSGVMTDMSKFLTDNKAVMTIIYDKYQPEAIKVYEYIKTTPWTVDSASDKIAKVARMVLQNDIANKMFREAYVVDLEPYTKLLKMAKRALVGEAIENYAKKTGFTDADAKKLKDGIKDLAEWVTEFYNKTYKTHIKDKLDTIFTNIDVKAIVDKIKNLINDPDARGLVLDGIEKIDANWPYIKEKLGEYGFNASAFEGFKNRVLDSITNINDKLNNENASVQSFY
jgi:hypothetical protein